MSKRAHYPEVSMPMIVQVAIDTNPTPKQLQDWKDLFTWLLKGKHGHDILCTGAEVSRPYLGHLSAVSNHAT